jgi:hypothetical protein
VTAGGESDAVDAVDAVDGDGGSRAARRRRPALVAGGVGLVIAVVVAVLVIGGGSDDDDSNGDDAAATTEADDTTSSTTTTSTTAPTTTTTTAPALAAAGIEGVFSMQLPSTWASIGVNGDMHGRGAEMFPDDAEHAALADQIFDTLLTPQSRFLALDGDAPADVTQSDMFIVESGPGAVDVETAFAAAKDHTNAEVLAEGRITTPAGDAPWYEIAGPAGLNARNYIVAQAGVVWRLTYWSSDEANRAANADQLVATFTPTAAI